MNNASSLKPKYSLEIWNGSVGGYDVRKYYLYLKNKGLNYTPDMVVIFLCLNDFDIDTTVFYRDEKGVIRECVFVDSEFFRRHPPNLFFMRHSRLYRLLTLRLNAYLLNAESMGGQRKGGAYYLGCIKELCEKKNVPLRAIIFPYLKPVTEYNNIQRRQYSDIKQALNASKIDYLDLHDYVSGVDLYSLRNEKKDDIHAKGENTHYFMDKIFLYLLNDFSSRGRMQ